MDNKKALKGKTDSGDLLIKNNNKEDYLKIPELKLAYTKKLFAKVAPRYDLITRLLSFNQDKKWKKYLVNFLPKFSEIKEPFCLDLACGTGDLTKALAQKYPKGNITGLDITPAMIDLAKKANKAQNINFICEDMSETKLDNNSYDVITGGYALRNASNIELALKEISRLLKRDGIAAFLEFSRPANSISWTIQYHLLKFWGNLWGLIIHRDPSIYAYIAQSCKTYPNNKEFKKLCQEAGLIEIHKKTFMFSTIEIIILKKQ